MNVAHDTCIQIFAPSLARRLRTSPELRLESWLWQRLVGRRCPGVGEVCGGGTPRGVDRAFVRVLVKP
eukprot:SAG11_NODE_17930_length_505_cov_0.628079_1_plen_68_part_00